jgi:hypothetical protein
MVGGSLRVLRFLPPLKLVAMINILGSTLFLIVPLGKEPANQISNQALSIYFRNGFKFHSRNSIKWKVNERRPPINVLIYTVMFVVDT